MTGTFSKISLDLSKEAKRAKYDGNRVIIEPTRTTLQYRSGAHVKGEKS